MGSFDTARLQLEGIVHELLLRRRRGRAPRRLVALPPEPTATLVCVSNRPEQMEHVIATWQAQSIPTELVLVTNADKYGETATERLAASDEARVIDTPSSMTLGAALNLGFEAAHGSVIAKIDDDDHYASGYLADAIQVMRETGAGVVGKKTYFVYLEQSDETVKMFPGNEHRRVGRMAGGTITVHRDVLAHARFSEVDLGEDGRFVRSAERAGFGVASGAAFGYLQVRSPRLDHAWQASEDQLRRSSVAVGPGTSETYWQGH